MSSFSSGLIFPQQLKCGSNIALLNSGTYNQMLYWIKAQDRMARAIALCWRMLLCFLRYCTCFLFSFLPFTWSRNMKKESVSCIICDRQILS